MSDPKPLGMLETCRVCGGTNRRTGRTRLGPPHGGLGDAPGAGDPNRLEEIACTQCDRRIWNEIISPDDNTEGPQ